MWYFAWILGVGLALAFGIINVMWLEADSFFEEDDIRSPPRKARWGIPESAGPRGV
ncbi:MAG: cytochrome bd-I oxidase subunit CydX [Pseudomonadota bacterium]|jgi:cyd operon protein YbgT